MSYTELAESTLESYQFAREMLQWHLEFDGVDPWGQTAFWLGQLNQHEERMAMILSWDE